VAAMAVLDRLPFVEDEHLRHGGACRLRNSRRRR
jgi:hypothetical protein